VGGPTRLTQTLEEAVVPKITARLKRPSNARRAGQGVLGTTPALAERPQRQLASLLEGIIMLQATVSPPKKMRIKRVG
jgi:hypothetical protein